MLLFWLDDGGVSSEEGFSAGDGDPQDGQLRSEDRELKDRLLRRFGSHVGSLKLEFSKKKKRGKLPKDARQTLLQWWNIHYKWPYPTVNMSFKLHFHGIYIWSIICYIWLEVCNFF